MANCAWSELFPLTIISISGLRALIIDPFSPCSIKQLSKREARFGLIEDCAKKSKIRELVQSHWSCSKPESVISKTNRVRGKIIEWTKDKNAKSIEVTKSTQDLLEEALSLSLSAHVPDPECISSISRLLEQAYLDEEEYWKQQSRIQWLQCDDRNSGFFHAVTRGRWQANKLSIIEDD